MSNAVKITRSWTDGGGTECEATYVVPARIVKVGGVDVLAFDATALYVTCSDDPTKIARIECDALGVLNSTVVTPDA